MTPATLFTTYTKSLTGFIFLNPLGHSEDVAIGVADVHFAGAPGFIGRWMGNFDADSQAMLMQFVNIIDQNPEPDAFIGTFGMTFRCGQIALTSATLITQAEEDAAFA